MLLLHNTTEYANALKNAYRQFPAKGSTLDIDFINQRQRVAGVQESVLTGLTATRTTTGNYIDSTSLIQTAAIDTVRSEYDSEPPRPLGLLIEGSRANSLINSYGTVLNSWTKTNCTVTDSGVASPLVGVNLQNITSTITGSTSVGITSNAISPAIPAACSAQFLFQCVGNVTGFIAVLVGYSARAVVFPKTKTVISSGYPGPHNILIKSIPGFTDTFLISMTWPLASATTQVRVFLKTQNDTNTGTGTPIVTGDLCRMAFIQLEEGASSTSYVPTTTTAVTRGADVVSMTGADFSKWFAAGAGTLFVRAMLKGTVGVAPILQLDDGTGNEIISVRGNGSDPELYIVDGGVSQAQIDGGVFTSNTYTNIAVAWAENDAAISQNGGPVIADDSVTLPTVTQMRVGSDGTNYLNGHIARATYWPYRLPNPLLQYLSRLTA